MTTGAGKRNVLTIVLFATYAVVLVGIILFKFPFQYDLSTIGSSAGGLSTNGRDLNLIPFAGNYSDSRGFGVGDLVENVLVFIPLGVYLSMLRIPKGAGIRWFWMRALVVAGTSVAFEVIQYAFAIGHADITDVICDTVGGVVGIGVYGLAAVALKSRTTRVLNIIAIVLTVLALVFFVYLRLHSR